MPTSTSILSLVLDGLEIPDSAYKKAEKRYEGLGEFLGRPQSRVQAYDPYVFSQGSFELGTVIRPLGADGEYDLDLGCSLRVGMTKNTHSQKELKEMLGEELEDYRTAQQIERELESKRRCWRLAYKDELAFHMDVVPCIPERNGQIGFIKEAMISRGADETLASEVADRAVSITDSELPSYPVVSPKWLLSNPQGYARWFQSRVALAKPVSDQILMEKRAEVESIPDNRRKAPLQRVVQLLKRHRNVMFQEYATRESNPQPISVIITTLAAQAYEGEVDVQVALANVLAKMGDLVNATTPRVPNPVNPAEDFADKWATEEDQKLNLEGNFKAWLAQAQRDFAALAQNRSADGIDKLAEDALHLKLDRRAILESLGGAAVAPAVHTRTTPIVDPPKQWRDR